ncbi:Suppressor of cytokine signaling 6 [Holothuria leucospilota]|uniref:Suppressor of cytokine signaling 6 n=1 Tax=Holothuria leucospilota TaxID=206669 RepID=A0A9Q1HDA4_HOLLE|nr:Suppressor of cytokine signaling 6 [Holothuria leucospilota]
MSSTRNLSVKKLTSSLWPKSNNKLNVNGVDSWMDKSSSLPNLAKTSDKASFSDSSENVCGIGDSVNAPSGLKKKTQRFIRGLRLKSLSKQQKLNHKLISSDETRPKTNSLHVHATNLNEYDRFPGSDLERTERGPGSGNETFAGPSSSNAVSPTRIGKHHFSSSRIGYINPKKNVHEERTLGNVHEVSAGVQCDSVNTTGSDRKDILTELSCTSLADKSCSSCSDKTKDICHHCTDVQCDPTKELHDRLGGTHISVSTDSLVSSVSSSGSEIFPQDVSSIPNVYQNPPARPPKPLSLRGRPLVESETTSLDDDVYEEPPRPPAREPTTRRCNALRSIALVNDSRLSGTYETINDDSPPVVQVPECGLPGELRKLPHQPWYWGPLTQEQAEAKLRGLPDGYFLVRDSSDDRYLLSLSFNSNGRPVHTRFEYIGGHFSINDSQGYTSVIDLIEEAVRESQNGVYSFMQNINGTQTFPARLTHPVSRFTEMKSLQHLCRFVIRETFPRHYVADLPVPEKIRKYILENQY